MCPEMRISCGVSVASDQSDDDVVFMNGGTTAAVTTQSVRWSNYQPKTWSTLLDEHCRETSVYCLLLSFVLQMLLIQQFSATFYYNNT